MDSKQLLNFLSKLKKNNTKEWFDTNKPAYEHLKKEWLLFVDDLIDSIRKFDASMGEMEAKKCIFRINRDVRFSKDKSPYKTNFGASINKGGKNGGTAGYYIHIEPGNCFIAGGMYMPEAPILQKVREEIDYHPEIFKKIISAGDFKKHFGGLTGDALSRPPKGYEADNPAIEFLKHKSFLAVRNVSDKDVNAETFTKEVIASFKAMKPLLDFLNSAL